MGNSPRQYDFGRNWKKKIAPLLGCPGVMTALSIGMKAGDREYEIGDPPWKYGRDCPGRTPKPGCLSWYQPLRMCHYIAPFCWELGMRLFPKLEWGFISGDFHTVVIGWADNREVPEWVMDILLFRTHTADQSLHLAKLRNWAFYPSFARYAASFCSDPERAYESLRTVLVPGDGPVAIPQGVSTVTESEVMVSA